MLLPVPTEFSQISLISPWSPYPSFPWKSCSVSIPSTHSVGHVGCALPTVIIKTSMNLKMHNYITLWPNFWNFTLQFVPDSARMTKWLCNLNMNCILCAVHWSQGFINNFVSQALKETELMVQVLCHLYWPNFMTSTIDHT